MLRVLVLILALGLPAAQAQLSYSRGQTVAPAYEGWELNPDGSINLIFGYMNQNWEEELDVPVGPDNNISPGAADQGQPTHFLPRRNRFVFRVKVPKDFGEKELVWSLTTRGKTIKAYATLKQDYFLDNMIFTSESGAIGAGVSSPAVRANKPPAVKIDGDNTRTVKVGAPLTLSAWVTDDGVPKKHVVGDPFDRKTKGDLRMVPPRFITVDSATGLWVALYPYRTTGTVKVSPDQPKPWEDTRAGANSQWAPRWEPAAPPADGKWTATATFDEPGTYVLRWHASDGALWDDQEITVIVTR